MKVLIKTEKSFLNQYDLPKDFNKRIENITQRIEDDLLVNPSIFVYGKRCYQHRAIAFYSNESKGYKYSGQLAISKELKGNLKSLMDYINKKFNSNFNGILVNKYNNGKDYIGRHSDDECGLSNIGVIAISYGGVRKFRIRDKKTKKIVKDIPTLSNKIIHMGGNFQKEFTHEIPIERKVNDIRWSFTFRRHLK